MDTGSVCAPITNTLSLLYVKLRLIFLGTKFFLGVDDDAKIYVEGTLVDEHHTWTAPFVITVSPATSVIPIQVRNTGGPGMFVLATSSGVLSRSGNPVCRLGSESGKFQGDVCFVSVVCPWEFT